MQCTKSVAIFLLLAVCTGCAETVVTPVPASYPFNTAQEFSVPCALWFKKTETDYHIKLNRHPVQPDGSPDPLLAQGNFGALIKVQVTQGDRAPRGYDGTHGITVVVVPDETEIPIRDLTVRSDAIIGLALDSCQAFAAWP